MWHYCRHINQLANIPGTAPWGLLSPLPLLKPVPGSRPNWKHLLANSALNESCTTMSMGIYILRGVMLSSRGMKFSWWRFSLYQWKANVRCVGVGIATNGGGRWGGVAGRMEAFLRVRPVLPGGKLVLDMLPLFVGLIFKKPSMWIRHVFRKVLFLLRVRPVLVPSIRAHVSHHPQAKSSKDTPPSTAGPVVEW